MHGYQQKRQPKICISYWGCQNEAVKFLTVCIDSGKCNVEIRRHIRIMKDVFEKISKITDI